MDTVQRADGLSDVLHKITATGFSPPQERAPILPAFCSFVEILYVQNNLAACYGLGMRQPAHGCNVRAKRLTHFILTFLS
jgi:hypothetical protein